MYRAVILFEELGDLRFISHLELLRIMERTFRRAELPLKFSQGFNPHPKIAFAYPLSVGVSSSYELMDVELTEKIEPSLLKQSLERNMPPGLVVKAVKYTESKESLMSLVQFAEYTISFTLTTPISQEAFQRALDSEAWLYQKMTKKKKFVEQNIRPMILNLELTFEEGRHTLAMKIHHSSESSVKADTVFKTLMTKLGVEETPSRVRIHRKSLIGAVKSVDHELFQCI